MSGTAECVRALVYTIREGFGSPLVPGPTMYKYLVVSFGPLATRHSFSKIFITPVEFKYHMAAQDSHQTNDFSAEEFSRYIPRQPPNLVLENAWVSLQHRAHSA